MFSDVRPTDRPNLGETARVQYASGRFATPGDGEGVRQASPPVGSADATEVQPQVAAPDKPAWSGFALLAWTRRG